MTIDAPGDAGLEILPLPAFNDNYIWTLRRGDKVVVVDPGDPAPVESYLAREGLDLTAILITHHHADHTGGIGALTARRDIPVYGPAAADIAGVTAGLADGDSVDLPELDRAFEVLEVPGHTATHIAFLSGDLLFPGDTLFSAGCGRLLGGTAEQLHASLERLKDLPGSTRVYCTHEYTLANLKFAQAAEPDNAERDAWFAHCRSLRSDGQPTLPSTMERERAINPFLRTGSASVIKAVTRHTGRRPASDLACFTALRAWKDEF
ncbi:hydroxyacylglutathione hydrolase [Pseudazoarcus pumilus]|uniref:Hydroxyacylglutathione hydrolase n=1 Tax=Pseudazoarcus pumilus TaxID=2067960 RepID=A0A2I6S6G0_9RHOO|nr:hydroxyacylglutathione hydrolase [Pseudazoarcus pumilus]AUN94840.1 hydroxyacylglutathione hydrolase [Pseudazoarcus pumilus]